MIKYKVYIKAMFFLMLLIGLFSFSQYRNAKRKVSKPNIIFKEGDNLFITRKEVNKLLIQSYDNIKISTKENLNLKVLEKGILKSEMIENVEVYVSVDGKLQVEITQRKPIFRIKVNDTSYYLDDKGKKMPLSKNYAARVPVVTGVQSDFNIKQLYSFYKKVWKDTFIQKQIVGINITDTNEFELKTRIGNHIIEFGKLQRVVKKIKKIKVFYKKVLADNTYDKYKKINVKYNNQIVCTKKELGS